MTMTKIVALLLVVLVVVLTVATKQVYGDPVLATGITGFCGGEQTLLSMLALSGKEIF